MAEEFEDLYNKIQKGLRAGDDVLLQRQSVSTRYSLVTRAVRMGNVILLGLLLDGGCPANSSETDHDSPLHLALETSRYEMRWMMEVLLKRGADANRKNENGKTPLLIAVERNHSEIVELLLRYGADITVDLFNAIREGNLHEATRLIDSPEQSASSGLLGGYSPLRLAVELNHVDIVKLLLDRGYPPNARITDHNCPLHLAIRNGNCEMVELLLKKGADVNSKIENGETQLFFAAERKHLRIVELLLEYGADVNAEKKGVTTLHFFYYHSDHSVESEKVILEIAKLLLNKGANINAQTHHHGFTPLHASVRIWKSYLLADLLLRCNADPNLTNRIGETALHLAVEDGAREIVSSLLAKGADVNAKTSNGRTPLHIAVDEGHGELVELLLANGATVNCVDRDGDPLFHYLAKSENFRYEGEMRNALLKWGADVNRKTERGTTALHIAVKKLKVRLVEFLLNNGAQVNCKDKDGETPLHWACTPKTIDILMKFGANIDCRSDDGRTPLHFMSSCDRSWEVATLLEYGADINFKCNRGLTPLDWTHHSVGGLLLDEDDNFNNIGRNLTRDVLLQHQAEMEGVGLHVEESQFSAQFSARYMRERSRSSGKDATRKSCF